MDTMTAELVVGSRVDLVGIGIVTNPGTVIERLPNNDLKVAWDQSVTKPEDPAYAEQFRPARLRPLTEVEQRRHPIPPLVKAHLATLDTDRALVRDRDVMVASLPARLAKSEGWVDLKVVVTSVTTPDYMPLVGQVVVLMRRDVDDPNATFRVSLPDDVRAALPDSCTATFGSTQSPWVHDVEWWDPSATKNEVPAQEPMVPKADHERTVEQLMTRTRAAERALETFKADVLAAAVTGAADNGWCREIKDIVSNLGLDWPQRRVSFTVHLAVEMTATCRKDDEDATSESFIKASLSLDDADVSMDEDWQDVEVGDTLCTSVDSVTLLDD